MKTVAVMGDKCTHDAIIMTGSITRTANGKPIARQGDIVMCPQHGKQTIVTCDPSIPLTDGLPTAHEGAKVSCGAIILPSIHNTPEPFSGNISGFEAAQMEQDDEFESTGGTSSEQARNRAIRGTLDQDSEPTPADSVPVVQATPPSCKDIPTNAQDGFRLSQFYNLGELSSRAALAPGAGTSSGPVVTNMGLSRETIICNLRHLATNSLDPIARHFGKNNIRITSGFRQASGGSDHNIGSAVDMQFLENGQKVSGRRLDEIEKYIINKLQIPFTQIIHENNSWLHIACRRSGINSSKRVCWWAGGSIYHNGFRY
jgi:uncharacterized Zn-binding protein involved in type VI secretion